MLYELQEGTDYEESTGCDSPETYGGSMKLYDSVALISRAPVHRKLILTARAFVCALLLCLTSVDGWAQQKDQQQAQQKDQQQMRSLDDQVQEVKSDVL